MAIVSRFADAIDAARSAAPTADYPEPAAAFDYGPEVQLSVRVPEGLRSAVASTAAAQKMTVTAFVDRALRSAVTEANDSFAGLAADLARNVRAELRAAIDDGTYREASAAVEQEGAWS
jgi:hypothetical protein